MGVVVSSMLTTADDSLLQIVSQVGQAVLQRFQLSHAEVSVVLGDDELLRSLNREWRGIDEPTDVLSFGLLARDELQQKPASGGQPLLLGDVVISLPRAREQAQEYGHGLEREVAFLTVHGVLHLLGFEHEEDEEAAARMRREEETVLAQLGWGR